MVTDNGSEVAGAFEKLLRRYGIPQIKISPYNKHANGLVEQGHLLSEKEYSRTVKII